MAAPPREAPGPLQTLIPLGSWDAGPAQALAPAQPRLPRKRASLNEAAVVHIYLAQVTGHLGLSRALAHQYGVTTKAVRDIWKERTWKAVTQPYRHYVQQQLGSQQNGAA